MADLSTPAGLLAQEIATLQDVEASVALALGGGNPDLAEAIIEPYIELAEKNATVGIGGQ